MVSRVRWALLFQNSRGLKSICDEGLVPAGKFLYRVKAVIRFTLYEDFSFLI